MFTLNASSWKLGVTALAAAAAGLAVSATPAAAANQGTFLVWNASGAEPQGQLTISVQCPYTFPYALQANTSGTNGVLFGPVTLKNYGGASSVTFYNPNSIKSNLRVTARLDVLCSTWPSA